MKLFNALMAMNFIKYEQDNGSGGGGSGGANPPGGDKGGKKDDPKKLGEGGGSADDSDDGADDGDEGDKQLDVASLPAAAQKLIKDLRKENGDTRKKLKASVDSQAKLKKGLIEAGILEDDSEAPEEKIKKISTANEQANFRNAILEAAIDNGVGKSEMKYFQFLVTEAMGELDEGGELDEAAIAELAKQAKSKAAPANSTTSVEGGGKQKPGASGDVTLDQFVNMNMGEKSLLFTKNPELYSSLFAQAKEKNLLIKR